MAENAKIIITGTGRAGTTFLVQLLTEIGLDTGYMPGGWQNDYDTLCAAGLERDPRKSHPQRILKNPAFCETLPELLAGGQIVVEHAIIPVRDLAEAARSRIWIGGRGRTAGGLWGTRKADQQQAVLAERFHRLMHTLARHDIPHTLLDFPRFTKDARYTWTKLDWLLKGIDLATFENAFARVARPELIHDFSGGVPAGAGEASQRRAREQFLRRLGRRVRRALVWGSLTAAAWILYSRL